MREAEAFWMRGGKSGGIVAADAGGMVAAKTGKMEVVQAVGMFGSEA